MDVPARLGWWPCRVASGGQVVSGRWVVSYVGRAGVGVDVAAWFGWWLCFFCELAVAAPTGRKWQGLVAITSAILVVVLTSSTARGSADRLLATRELLPATPNYLDTCGRRLKF